ncbi:Fe-S cluster assembly sulfur transfer protein SufU [Lactobacillaceae bacterium Melli_B4]
MGLMKLDQLYRSVVLEHASYPKNYGTLSTPSDSLVLRNPSCGDIINVQIKMDNNVIKDIKFKGTGCTISKASASMMTMVIKGHTIQESHRIIKMFFDNIVNKDLSKDEQAQIGDAFLLSTVAKFPTRIRCATLSWHALSELINNKEVKVND